MNVKKTSMKGQKKKKSNETFSLLGKAIDPSHQANNS